MTTDPTRPSDPSEPASTPPPSTPPPSNPPPSEPPPTSPPPVSTADPLGATAGSYPGAATPVAEAAAYPPPDAAAYPPPAAPTYPPPASDYGSAPPSAPPPTTARPGFDLASATTFDRGIAGAAVLFLIAMVLPWASVSFDTDIPGVEDASQNGFGSGLLTLGWLLLVIAAAIALLPAFGANIKLPVPRPLAILSLTGVALLITLIGFIDALTAPSEVKTVEDLGVGVDYSAGIGAYLGFLVAIGAVVIAYLAFQASRNRPVAATA